MMCDCSDQIRRVRASPCNTEQAGDHVFWEGMSALYVQRVDLHAQNTKVVYSATLLQICVLASSKTSILILLYRIFITKAFRRTVLVLMAIVATWWIATSFAVAFICSPVRSQWNSNVPGHCRNQYLLDIIDPIPWILTDFAILFAPMPMVWKLQMPIRQKVAVTSLFLVVGLWALDPLVRPGALLTIGRTCVISCIRYRYVFYSLTDPTCKAMLYLLCQRSLH